MSERTFCIDPVQTLALLAVGNLAFCLENRHTLVTSESLRDLLVRLTVASEPRVNKAAARALAILGLSMLKSMFSYQFSLDLQNDETCLCNLRRK